MYYCGGGVRHTGAGRDGQKRGADARGAIRHFTGHLPAGDLPANAERPGITVVPGKWRKRYRVPPYAGCTRGAV